MSIRMLVAILVTAFPCGGGSVPPGEPSDACDLADDHAACPECYSGDVTCSYDGIDVTAPSCGDCQARASLYEALCDAGVGDSAEEIERGTVCEEEVPPHPGVEVDACALALEYEICPDCDSGEVTCGFEDVEVTTRSCGDCDALGLLYRTLCADEVEGSIDELIDGTECWDDADQPVHP